MPASTASSSRRSPGTRRWPPKVGSPACSGVMRARLVARKSRTSLRLSTTSTLRPAQAGREVLALPGRAAPATLVNSGVLWRRDQDEPRASQDRDLGDHLHQLL